MNNFISQMVVEQSLISLSLALWSLFLQQLAGYSTESWEHFYKNKKKKKQNRNKNKPKNHKNKTKKPCCLFLGAYLEWGLMGDLENVEKPWSLSSCYHPLCFPKTVSSDSALLVPIWSLRNALCKAVTGQTWLVEELCFFDPLSPA